MPKNPFAATSSNDPVAMRDTTTRSIALGLLATFIATVVALMLINYCAFRYGEDKYTKDVSAAIVASDNEMRKAWFDILKNSLILLGTALTTVIGYYFGQREGAAKAAKAEDQAIKAENQAESKVAAADRQAAAVVADTVDNTAAALREAAPSQSAASSPTADQSTYKEGNIGGPADIIVPK
jgi:hypothetical protein